MLPKSTQYLRKLYLNQCKGQKWKSCTQRTRGHLTNKWESNKCKCQETGRQKSQMCPTPTVPCCASPGASQAGCWLPTEQLHLRGSHPRGALHLDSEGQSLSQHLCHLLPCLFLQITLFQWIMKTNQPNRQKYVLYYELRSLFKCNRSF